ncbi:MAG: pilus assembly protein TadG-related protein [Candidatus Limnocylindria bacterium]
MVVIVALMFTVLLGFSALAIDVGRYFAERRFLQDGADAAALACARAYALGGNSADAWAAGNTILTDYNLKNDPLGITVTVPAQGSESYYDNIIIGPQLKNGVLPTTSPVGCRVAVYIDVPTLLIQVANPALDTLALNVRAYAIAGGGFVPVVVPKYSYGPGPGNGSDNNFIHHTMKEDFDYQCSVSSDAGCTPASNSETEDGREFVLFGQSQKATNDNSFRGYIALDVRDFTTVDADGDLVHKAYNGVAPDASVSTLKDFEATWIREGYPGPELCAVDAGSFDRCAQVAVINGASAGIFVPEIKDRYQVGDVLLAQLYDGTVKTIPNFTINFPTLLVASSTGSVPTQTVSFTMSSEFEGSTAQVNTTFIPDNGTVTGGAGDPLNPWVAGTADPVDSTPGTGDFSSNPTPQGVDSYSQSWSNIVMNGAPQGIYAAFLKGEATAPYAGVTQTVVVTVNIGEQQRQFFLNTSDAYMNVDAVGTPASHTIRLTDGNGVESWDSVVPGGNITLQIDQCPTNGATTLTCFFGPDSPGTQSETLLTPTENKTLTVLTVGATNGSTYTGWVRAFGFDGLGNKVTRILQIRTAVNVVSGGTTEYVDIVGYAVFRVTKVDPNEAFGKAITGTYLDPNDPALAIGKDFRLVPWEYVQ